MNYFQQHPLRLICLLTILFLLPFVNKAFHVDDPLFVWSAQQIHRAPLNPLGFTVNWNDYPEEMSRVTKNPPGACYYIAAVAAVAGFNEIPLHIAFWLPACLVTVGTFVLAQRFVRRPLWAALLVLVSPVFWISATSVMSDVPMLALLLWGVIFWFRGVDEGKIYQFAVAGLLFGLALVTKYFALLVLPLVLVHAVLRRPRGLGWLLTFLIPFLIAAGYEYWTKNLYGLGLIWEAAGFARNANADLRPSFVLGLTIGLFFCGGCLFPLCAVCLRYASWKWWLAGAAIAAVCVLWSWQIVTVVFRSNPNIQWTREIWLQGPVLTLCALVLLFNLARTTLHKPNDTGPAHIRSDVLFLGLWAGLAFVFTFYINWIVNGRSLLPMVPPAAILVVRALEQHWPSASRLTTRKFVLAMAPCAVLAFLVVQGDAQMANTHRAATQQVQNRYGANLTNWYISGHWGFQYYMQRLGGQPIHDNGPAPAPGSYVIVPPEQIVSYRIMPGPGLAEQPPIAVPEFALATTMNVSSNFYAAIGQYLPFSFASRFGRTFRVYRTE